MIHVHEPSHIPGIDAGSCLTIGNFDGVHVGHQALIVRTRDAARAMGVPSVVVTFDPHPLRFFTGRPHPPFITTPAQKERCIAALGVDALLTLTFDAVLASMPPERFVEEVLVHGLGVRQLFIGYDYAFGKGRKGDFALLTQLGACLGFTVEQLPPVLVGGVVVSSTRIRDLLLAGDVWAARALLGRFHCVEGTVVPGHRRGGAVLGFPTANLLLTDELFPKTGVYCAWAEWEGIKHPAVLNIGFNPTFGGDVLSVEAHVLDFSGDLYGRHLALHLVQRLRGERKFAGVDALRDQIGRDVALARSVLSLPEAKA